MTMAMIGVASLMPLAPSTTMTMAMTWSKWWWSEWPCPCCLRLRRQWRWWWSDQSGLAHEDVECVILFFLCWGKSWVRCEKREKKSRPKVRGERKPNKKHYFGLPHLSVPLQICNNTNTNDIILAHMQHLIGAVFCVWCEICAKYLVFDTYPTSTVGAIV